MDESTSIDVADDADLVPVMVIETFFIEPEFLEGKLEECPILGNTNSYNILNLFQSKNGRLYGFV